MRQWSFKRITTGIVMFLALTAGVHAEDISRKGLAACIDGDSLQTAMKESTVKKKGKKPEKRYEDRIEGYRKSFMRLIPTHSKLQFYGDMGLASLGVGWDYGKSSQWETDLLFGFIPKNYSGSVKVTMTLKQTYNPWSINLEKRGASPSSPCMQGFT